MLPSNITHASSRAITRPPCSKCGTTMMFARIGRGGSEFLDFLSRKYLGRATVTKTTRGTRRTDIGAVLIAPDGAVAAK